MHEEYNISVPGKIIINGGYLVLNNHECVSIVPSMATKIYVKKEYSKDLIISIKTNFKEYTDLFFRNMEFVGLNNITPSMQYFIDIITTFIETSGYVLNCNLKIRFEFSDILYSYKRKTMRQSIKTGLGSSCAILIGLVYSLLPTTIDTKKFIDICLEINRKLSPQSSGCDIVSCIVGSCIYKKYSYEKIEISKQWVLLLGSFNKSTNTRKMIDRDFSDEKWGELGNINASIIGCYRSKDYASLRLLYLKYLKCLKKIDTNIVPDLQYDVLMQVFEFDVIGCGASGSGGEDCVWCLVEEDKLVAVYTFWQAQFIYKDYIRGLNGFTSLNREFI